MGHELELNAYFIKAYIIRGGTSLRRPPPHIPTPQEQTIHTPNYTIKVTNSAVYIYHKFLCDYVCVYVCMYIWYVRPFGPTGGAAGAHANEKRANDGQLNEGRRSHMVG